MSYIRYILTAKVILLLPFLFMNCSQVDFADTSQKSAGLDDRGGTGLDVPPTGVDPNDPGNENLPNTIDKNFDARVQNYDKVDFLLVIDDSKSMVQERSQMAARFDGLVSGLNSGGIDWQMCYYTTNVVGVSSPGEGEKWAGTNSQVLSRSTPNNETIFANTLNNIQTGGQNSGYEMGIRATYHAVLENGNRNCFRSDAVLAVIVLSDEDEDSCYGRCSDSKNLTILNSPTNLVNTVEAEFNGEKPMTFHSIVVKEGDAACWAEQDAQYPAYYGEAYSALSRNTGGIIGSVCENDYAAQLQSIGQRVGDTLSSIVLDCAPIAGSLSVTIENNTLSSTYRVEGNKLIFTPALPEGSRAYGSFKCYERI